MSRYERFDACQLVLWPIAERGHDLTAECVQPLAAPLEPFTHPDFSRLSARIREARRNDRPVILMMGAHPIKLGLSRFLIDLIERRFITHVATNGAGLIHDFELALVGGTSEDVTRWIRFGQFGLWQETSRLNDVIRQAAGRDEGLGEAVGRTIEEEQFPFHDLSIAAAGWRCGVPVTCHVSIGSDIHHAMPNCDGSALGQTSYSDFLIFARSIQDLEGGVYLNVGTAVTGPEVYLKALSMARNVNRQRNRRHEPPQTLNALPLLSPRFRRDSTQDNAIPEPRRFTAAVFDLIALPDGYGTGTPSKDDALYYFRPWKTILVRTVADGGETFYYCGDHRQTIPTLWWELTASVRQSHC